MLTERPKVLKLPDDPNRLVQLRVKREEYSQRLFTPKRPDHADAAVKLIVLHCLLESESGEVQTDDILIALGGISPTLWAVVRRNPIIFDNACMVIALYCQGSVDEISGGSGLPGLD